MVGRYADASGATHGLFFVPRDNFFTFDYPGSTFTSLNGISSQGLSVVVTSMLPALPTDSWLASEAHRRHNRRERK